MQQFTSESLLPYFSESLGNASCWTAYKEKKKREQCYRSVTTHRVSTVFIRLEIHFERLTNVLSNVYWSALSSPLPVLHFFQLVFYLPQHSLSSLISPPPHPHLFFSFILLPSLCPPAVAPCHPSPSVLLLHLFVFSLPPPYFLPSSLALYMLTPLSAEPLIWYTSIYIYIYTHKH